MSVTLYKDNTYQVYIRNERGKVYIYHVYIRKLREVRDITLHLVWHYAGVSITILGEYKRDIEEREMIGSRTSYIYNMCI